MSRYIKLMFIALMLCSTLTLDAQSMLYRSRISSQYRFLYNGHFYWSTPEFSRGEVCFEGLVYKDVLLNIDAYTQQLMVKEDTGYLPLSPDRESIAWFTKDGVRYTNMRYAGHDTLPEGFFVTVTDGKKLYYKQVRKRLYSDTANQNGEGGIGYEDPKYRSDVLTYFRLEEFYYTIKKGELKHVRLNRWRRAALKPTDVAIEAPDSYLAQRDIRPSESEIKTAKAFKAGTTLSELPTGYFSSGNSSARSALLDAIEQDNLIASYRNKTYIIGKESGKAKATLSGQVRDVATGELLAGVAVCDKTGKYYTYTNSQGQYSLSLPTGSNTVTFSEYTKEDMPISIILQGDGGLDIVMKEKVTALRSAYVSAEGMAEHRRTTMGLEKMNIKTVSKIPSAFGEGDVLKAVLTLPGVKSVGEAASGFNVRGGSSDQNLILFNEGTIYNPSHMFGIFSAFNPDVVENVELYKSSIPVEYGGRISSVLEIQSKEGAQDRIRGTLGIGLLTSHFSVEGPIVKDRTTFVLGGRTTYSNWMLDLIPEGSGYSGGRANFGDVNLGVTHKINDRNTIQAFGYYSRDGFSFSNDTTFRYSNVNAALKWKHKFGEKDQLTVNAGFDRYSNSLDDFPNSYEAFTLSTSISQAHAKAVVKQKRRNHTITWGSEARFYSLKPGTLTPYGEESLAEARTLRTENALEPSLFAGDNWNISDMLSVDGGVRLSGLLATGPKSAFHPGADIRLSAKYSPLANLSFKGGVSTMTQYMHLISNTSSISPMDTWKLCDASVAPMRGIQAAAGAYWTVFDSQVDLSAETYFKETFGCVDYKSGATLSMNENLADDLVRARGRSYGVELMARKSGGKLTGWISYTWSRSLLKEDSGRETAAAINGGKWYNAPHDKPHDFKLVGNYKFTHRYSISCNVDYSTGRPVTIPVGKYNYRGGVRFAYSERNAYRIPDYFRLDLAVNIEPGHYLKAFTHASFTIGCYNVTGRKNAYSVYYTTNGGSKVTGHMLSVFATQIPYASLNLKF